MISTQEIIAASLHAHLPHRWFVRCSCGIGFSLRESTLDQWVDHMAHVIEAKLQKAEKI